MPPDADVLIAGGAITGSATAYYLNELNFDGRVVVIEPDPTYQFAATALSASGIRQQFSTRLNIEMSAFGLRVIRAFGLDFHENGYLNLAATQAQADILRANHKVQLATGADVALLSPAQLSERFPHLNTADLTLAALGQSGEGWFDNMGLLARFRDGARQAGIEYVSDRVTGLTMRNDRIESAHLASGQHITCRTFVNATGGQGADIACLAGIDLPITRQKRTVFSFRAATPPTGKLPLMIGPTGVWCRPEGQGFIAGCEPAQTTEAHPEDFDPDHQLWEDVIWPALAARSPNFEALKLTGMWAGHYDMNTLDANAIIGPHPKIGNFYFANGFSGHGLQHAPAVGRGLAELITHGRYLSLDLSPFAYQRVTDAKPLVEQAII